MIKNHRSIILDSLLKEALPYYNRDMKQVPLFEEHYDNLESEDDMIEKSEDNKLLSQENNSEQEEINYLQPGLFDKGQMKLFPPTPQTNQPNRNDISSLNAIFEQNEISESDKEEVVEIAKALLSKEKFKSRDQILQELSRMLEEKGSEYTIQYYLKDLPELWATIHRSPKDQLVLPTIPPQINFLPTREEFSDAIDREKTEHEKKRQKYLKNFEEKKLELGRKPESWELDVSDPDRYSYRPEIGEFQHISKTVYNKYVNKFKEILKNIDDNSAKLYELQKSTDKLKPNVSAVSDFSEITSVDALIADISAHIKWGIYNVVKNSVGIQLFGTGVGKYNKQLVNRRGKGNLNIFDSTESEWLQNEGLFKSFVEYVNADYQNTARLSQIDFWADNKYFQLVSYNKGLVSSIESLSKGIRFFNLLQKRYDTVVDNKLQLLKQYNKYIFSQTSTIESIGQLHKKTVEAITKTSETLSSLGYYNNNGLYNPRHDRNADIALDRFGLNATLAAKIPYAEAIDSFANLAISSVQEIVEQIKEKEIAPTAEELGNELVEFFTKEILGLSKLPTAPERYGWGTGQLQAIGSPDLVKIADKWIELAEKNGLGSGYASIVKYPNFLIKDEQMRNRFAFLTKQLLGAAVSNFMSNNLKDIFKDWFKNEFEKNKSNYNGPTRLKAQFALKRERLVKYVFDKIKSDNLIQIPSQIAFDNEIKTFNNIYVKPEIQEAFVVGVADRLEGKYNERSALDRKIDQMCSYEFSSEKENILGGLNQTISEAMFSDNKSISKKLDIILAGVANGVTKPLIQSLNGLLQVSQKNNSTVSIASELIDSHMFSDDLKTQMKKDWGDLSFRYLEEYVESISFKRAFSKEYIENILSIAKNIKLNQIELDEKTEDELVRRICWNIASNLPIPEEFTDAYNSFNIGGERSGFYSEAYKEFFNNLSLTHYSQAKQQLQDTISELNGVAIEFNELLTNAINLLRETQSVINNIEKDFTLFHIIEKRYTYIGGAGPMYILSKMESIIKKSKQFEGFNLLGYAKYLINKTTGAISEQDSDVGDRVLSLFQQLNNTSTITRTRRTFKDGNEIIKQKETEYQGSPSIFATAIICKQLNITDPAVIEDVEQQVGAAISYQNIDHGDIELIFLQLIRNKNNLENQIKLAIKFANFIHNHGKDLKEADIKLLVNNVNIKDWLNDVNAIETMFTVYAKIKNMGGIEYILTSKTAIIDYLLKEGILKKGFVARVKKFLKLFTENTRVNPALENFTEVKRMIIDAKDDINKIEQAAVFQKYNSLVIPKDPNLFKLNWEAIPDKLRFRVLKSYDPYHFQVGSDTSCCQTIGGVGEASAIDSYINPLAGVVILEQNTEYGWKTVSQSYFHYVPRDNGIILDNVESSRLAGELEGTFDKDLEYFYALWARTKEAENNYKYFLCGRSYTKIDKDKFKKNSMRRDDRSFKYEKTYSDYKSSDSLNLLAPKFKLPVQEEAVNPEKKAPKKAKTAWTFSDVSNKSLRRLALSQLLNIK